MYEQSLKTLETLKDPRSIAVTQINLAQHLINWQKDLPRALELLWKGYEQIARIGNPREVGQVQEIIQAFCQQQGTRFVPLWESVLTDKPIPQWLEMEEQVSSEALLRAFVVIYREQGEGALRQALQQAGFPAEMVEMTVTIVQSMAGDSEDQPTPTRDNATATLPREVVEN